MIWKIWKKPKLNGEKLWKYRRKVNWIVKWLGKHGRNASRIVIRYDKYGSWNVKWYGKYGRKTS
jgi:hypothetical protein